MELACVVIALSLLRSSFSIDWCDTDLDCEIPNGTEIVVLKNTVCENVEHESKHHCRHMVKRPESSVKRTLLAMHNTFRNKIASGCLLPRWPAASNMRQMTWDDSLAEQALRWAFQCDEKEDDPCRTHPVYGEDEGQISGEVVQSSISASTPDLADVFSKWITEALKAPSSIVDSMSPGEHIHLAEIIYSHAHNIGCGVIDYEDASGQKAIRIVCNYDIGYLMGDPLYTRGDNCTCPSGTSCKTDSTYKKLCALKSDPIDENPIVVDFYDGLKPITELSSFSTSSTFQTQTVSVPNSSRDSTTSRIQGTSDVLREPTVTVLGNLTGKEKNSHGAVRGYRYLLTLSVMPLRLLCLF